MNLKKKIVFIINPISGVRRKAGVEKSIKNYLNHEVFEAKTIYTQYAGHAIEIANNEAKNGAEIVVAVGGDGSVNEVAQGLIGTNCAMGIIPMGSGNGLAFYFKIPLIVKSAIKIINKHKIRRIDTGFINDKLFVSNAGLGFDAFVAHKFSHCKKRGFLSYINIILRSFPKYRPNRFRISFGDINLARRAILLSFANSNQLGYMASVTPEAKINDGLLDLCIIRPIPIIKALFMANKLFLKNFDLSKNVEIYKTKKIKVETSVPVFAQIDGDPIGMGNSFIIEVKPKSLSVIVP